MEEYIGKVWDRYITKHKTKLYENEKVLFTDIKKSLQIFYHLMGGEKGKDLQITDKKFQNKSETFVEKISFGGDYIYLPWEDEKAIYLPPSCSFFTTKEENKTFYFWLVALLANTNITSNNFLSQNKKGVLFLVDTFDGFDAFYTKASTSLVATFPKLETFPIKELPYLQGQYPFPLWIYPKNSSLKYINEEDTNEEIQRESSKNKVDTLEMKKEAKSLSEKRKTDGFLSFLPESLMSILEQINVDRAENESFDENALYHAQDLDEITLGDKSANLASRIKMELDLQNHQSEVYPLGNGHCIDEWDYTKNCYLVNYVQIKPQISKDVTPIKLPKRLFKTVKIIEKELSHLSLDKIKNTHLPYGDELHLESWIEYQSHQNKSLHPQRFYETMEKKTRDIATLILADVSLSTEASITQDMRIIDIIKDSLMVFSKSFEKLEDSFALYTFSSLKNTKVYFNIIKNFNEKYSDLICGRIDCIKPGYYTRMGSAIRESTKILHKQKNQKKLLLIISDGKPNDLDRYDGRYGIEDTKKAILEAKQKGLIPFCITIDLDAKKYLSYLFGKNGFVVVSRVEKLPKILSNVYLNLTK